MPFIEITPPPGVIKPGTVYDAKGRWYDTLWVRWFEGVMQAIGGFEAVEISNAQVNAGERVSGTHGWRNNAGQPHLAWGGVEFIKVMKQGAVFDVTPPSGFTIGVADAQITSGNYGAGLYGVDLYGVGDTAISFLQEAQSWQMDNFGEDLVVVAISDGQLWYVDSNGDGGDPAVAVLIPSADTAPGANVGVVVTPERFVLALGASGDGRRIQWPDVDLDINGDFVWTPTQTNQAGDIFLPGKGAIMAGRRAQAETLVWTDQDLFSIRYIGGNFVYQAVPVGAVGAISRRSMAVVGSVAYWMGPRGFYLYNGYTQGIESPLADYVFADINQNQISKVWAEVRAEFAEVTWHYPSGGSTECDRSVTYNYNDGFWFNNAVERTAGEDRGAFNYPMAFEANGRLWRHEIGSFYGYEGGTTGSNSPNRGAVTGCTDFSEFSVGTTLPGGLSYVGTRNVDPPTQTFIGNDPVEGNFLRIVPENGAKHLVTFDFFDGVLTDVENDEIEILARVLFVPGAGIGGRTSGGPAAFAGGATEPDIEVFFGKRQWFTSPTGISTAGLSFSDRASGPVQSDNNGEEWGWIRWRVIKVLTDDQFAVKTWGGDLADEPATWDAVQSPTLGRVTTDLGLKIGLYLNQLVSQSAAPATISYMSYSIDPQNVSPPLPGGECGSIGAQVLVKPEATSGPIEIGKGDNVMRVQSLIPDEKTLGDVDLYLLSSFYPTAIETTHGAYTPANPTDVRITGRQIRLRVVEDKAAWRVGSLRADVELEGGR